MTAQKIYVLHENATWTAHLETELKQLGVPFELWFLDQGMLDLSQAPPEGVFFSRMSASSHTRGHQFAADYSDCVIRWLEAHGRVVINGSHALRLEMSKAAQYTAFEASGVRTPRTVVAVGTNAIVEAARQFAPPFIIKHNRSGKGLGVKKFDNVAALSSYLTGTAYDAPVDGITLVQDYVDSPEQFITRCEFVDCKFLYAVRVDTGGSFELCPADACAPGDVLCPAGADSGPRFGIIEGFSHPLIAQYEAFLKHHNIGVAAVEFVVDASGAAFTYDLNTNTNYNPQAEADAGIRGMATVARYLSNQLTALTLSSAPVQPPLRAVS
jgi:hypothetical protein